MFFDYSEVNFNARPSLHDFFISNTFISNARLNVCYRKIIHILHQRYHPKIIEHILKNKQKNKYVFIHEIKRES